jgi:hypothetical protein
MQPATSLGGVESLVEQRFQVDPSVDPKMLRISVGVENLEVRWDSYLRYIPSEGSVKDLKDDLRKGMQDVTSKVRIAY